MLIVLVAAPFMNCVFWCCVNYANSRFRHEPEAELAVVDLGTFSSSRSLARGSRRVGVE